MRFVCVFCLLLFVAFDSLAQSATTPSPARDPSKETAVVAGQVLRLDTGEGLKKAQVSLQSHNGEAFSAFRLTDEQGHFSIENVPPGAYDLHAERIGFLDAEYGQKKAGGSGAILTLSSGQHMTDLVFKLACGASISGRVTDEDGEPVPHAQVIVYRASRQAGREQRNNYDPASTNDLGEYRVFDLLPGRYFIAVNYRIMERNGRHNPFDKNNFNPGYLPTFYPNTTDASKAVALGINPGDEIRSIDFMLRPGHLVTVSGRVVNTVPGFAASTGGTVNLYGRNSGLSDAAQDLFSSFDLKEGHFLIPNVPAGSYYIHAAWWDRDTREWHRARRQLEVGTTDIENIVITITQGTDVPGRIVWEGSQAVDPQDLMIRLHPLDDEELGSPPPPVKRDGTFIFKGVPEGSYRPIVSLRGPRGSFFLKSARYGPTSLSSSGFTVQPGSELALELTLSARASRVNGVALNSDSLPATGATVVLIPDPPNRDLNERYLWATTDQNGKFTVEGVIPGDYKLFSWDSDIADPSEPEWYDATWLKPYETKGESIHLEESDSKAVNLTLIECKPDCTPVN